MSLCFNVVPKVDPRSPRSGGRRYYAVLKSLGLLDEREVARQLSEETTMTPKEAEFSIHQFEKILIRNLLNGHTVKVGELGSFSLTINSTGCDAAEDVSVDCIKNVNLNFRPSERIKQAVNSAEFYPSAADG